MSDSRLQELKRTWEASGSVEDEAAYLRERVRVGDLTQERLELAAYCGHEASSQILVSVPPTNATTKEWLIGLGRWGDLTASYAFLLLLESELPESTPDDICKEFRRTISSLEAGERPPLIEVNTSSVDGEHWVYVSQGQFLLAVCQLLHHPPSRGMVMERVLRNVLALAGDSSTWARVHKSLIRLALDPSAARS